MRTLTALLLFIFLACVQSEKVNVATAWQFFGRYPKEKITGLVRRMNAIEDKKDKINECIKDYSEYGSQYYWDSYEWSGDHVIIDQCFALVYNDKIKKQYIDTTFYLLPKRKVVSLFKAAELKSLFLRIHNRNDDRSLFQAVFDNHADFLEELKQLVRPERANEVQQGFSKAADDAWKERGQNRDNTILKEYGLTLNEWYLSFA